MSSFCEWEKLTSRNFYFGFCSSKFFGAWSRSSFCKWRSWPAEFSTLASMFIYILWCLKPELFLWVEKADQQNCLLCFLSLYMFFGACSMSSFCERRKLTSRNIYSGFYIYKYSWCLKHELLLWVEEADYRNIYSGFYTYKYSSVSGGSWPAEISTLAPMFIYILWCLKLELLLWMEEADQQKSLL